MLSKSAVIWMCLTLLLHKINLTLARGHTRERVPTTKGSFAPLEKDAKTVQN
jgi:hypothetical protein